MIELDHVRPAACLVGFGLRPKLRPPTEPEYRALVSRYNEDAEFRAVVREMASGLGLEVLDVGEHGIVLSSFPDSTFAFRAAELRASQRSDDRLIDGLVQVAIATAVYPRAQDLEDETTLARPPISVDEVDEMLRTICLRLEADARARPDPTVEAVEAGLDEAWRAYRRLLAAKESADGRKVQATTRRIIEQNLDKLHEFGCFTKDARRADSTEYQPTWRYQVLVRQLAAGDIHDRVQHALRRADAPATPAGGS